MAGYFVGEGSSVHTKYKRNTGASVAAVVSHGDLVAIQLLIDHGLQIDEVNDDNFAPLAYALVYANKLHSV